MKRARNKRSKRRFPERETKEYTGYTHDEYTHDDEYTPQDTFAPSQDSEPNDFAVPDEVFDANVGANDFESVPEEEVPFSTGDFETAEPVNVTPKNVAPQKDSVKMSKIAKIKKKRKKRRITTICLTVALLLIVLVTVIMGLDFSNPDKTPEQVYDFSAVDNETGKLNVLVLGVDKEGLRSDSIMLISYDFDDHTTKLLSVPRDTKMYVTDRNVTRKITEVHGMHNKEGKLYGAGAVAEAVSAITGVPINYYVEFSFDTVDKLMDILGPVEFDVPDIEGGGRGMNYDDPTQDLHIHLKPGVQKLSGNQIQQFFRYRKSNNGTSDGSDLSRVNRQQELLQAIVDQKVNLELITKVPGLFKELKSQLKTNLGTKDVVKYAGVLKNISSDSMSSFVIPGDTATIIKKSYFVCDLAQTAEMISTNFGYNVTADDLTTDISLSGKKATGQTKTSSDKTTSSKTSNNKISVSVSDSKEQPNMSKNTETKQEKVTEEVQINTNKNTTKKTETKSNETTKTDSTKKTDTTKKTETTKKDETSSYQTGEKNTETTKTDDKKTETTTENTKKDETPAEDKKADSSDSSKSEGSTEADSQE